MVRLVNAAIMPTPGLVYQPVAISEPEFVGHVRTARAQGVLASYIGYPATAEHITRLTGVEIPVNRVQTPAENGDMLLVCKLRYRPADPAMQRDSSAQATIDPADYEYWIVWVGQ